MITEQLRCAGVLEAVRFFRIGYHSNEDEAVLGTNLFLESNIGNITNSLSGKENKGCKYSTKTSRLSVIIMDNLYLV